MQAKLTALVRDHFDGVDGELISTPFGAALLSGDRTIVLVESDADRSFGPALALAKRHGSTVLDLLVSGSAQRCAARAPLVDPSPTVWSIDGTDLARVDRPAAAPIVAEPLLRSDLAELLADPSLNVRTIVEHGVITAEFRGVEIARVTGVGDEQRIDVGVGAYDQGAYAMMNPDLDPGDALRDVVRQVASHRRRGGEPHPLGRVARERWLRDELLDDPSLVGADALAPVEGPRERDGLRDVAPAFALGVAAGAPTLVACSVGIDLDLVPAAAEIAARHDATHIVFVLPERDVHPLSRELAGCLRVTHEFVVANEPWRATPDATFGS